MPWDVSSLLPGAVASAKQKQHFTETGSDIQAVTTS